MSIMKSWNFTRELLAFPCAEPTPIIWAATFLPAAMPAIVDFISFGCRDIVKHKAGIGQPCGKIFKAQAVATFGPKYADAIHNVLKFTHPLEKLLYKFFVVDLLADTFARWHSLAYEMSPCEVRPDMAAWQWDFLEPILLLPNRPTEIQGRLINVKGRPGVGWPSGAVVPPNWHFQGEFTAKAKSFRGDSPVSIKTWWRELTFGAYDFAAYEYPPGYPGQTVAGHGKLSTRAADRVGPSQYVMMAMTDETAILEDLEGTGQASELPILDWTVGGLGCFKDLTAKEVENPAGINPRGRQRMMIDPWKAIAPKPVRRGPKGGKPR